MPRVLAAVAVCSLLAAQEGQPAAAKVDFQKQVAPILEKKCASCHTEGGIGPFAMSSYEMVKGFSPMIREVIRTRVGALFTQRVYPRGPRRNR